MDKCREAFEKLPEIKNSLSENIVFIGNKYTTANDGFYDLVNWLNGGWWAWQSRQAEVDQLNSVLGERTKEWLEAIKLGTYFQDVAKQLKAEVGEKDKRIEELEKAEFKLAKVKQILDKRIKTKLLESIIVRELIDLLFSNNERGDNA